MYRNEINEIRQKIISAVGNAKIHRTRGIAELESLKTEMGGLIPAENPVHNLAVSMVWEALGDVHMLGGDMSKAEKAFAEMFFEANKAYTAHKENFRSRYGFCCYKRANFYRLTLGLAKPSYPPKKLGETQQKIFEMTEMLYKTAIGVTFQPGRPMPVADADLHSLCLHEMMIMYTAVGNIEAAVKYGRDGIEIEKTVYAKLSDKAHAFRMANRMNGLAAVYIAAQQPQPATELMEQSVQTSLRHKEEDPKAFEVLLARSYLTMGNCYAALGKTDLAEAAFKSGIKLMTSANEKSDNRLIDDVLTAYTMMGDFYIRNKKYAPAVDHYRWAYDMASALYNSTRNPKYAKITERLKKYVTT